MAAGQDQQGYQYYNALFQYNLVEGGGGTNLYFKDLINFTPVIAPYEEIGFKGGMVANRQRDDGDFGQFFMDRRLGVTQLHDYGDGTIITDQISYEGNQYVMYKKETAPSSGIRSIAIDKIESAININCAKYSDPSSCTKPTCSLINRMSSPCAHDKIIKLLGPKGKISTAFIGEIGNFLIGNSTIGQARGLDGGALSGNVIYVSSSDNAAVPSGIMRINATGNSETSYMNAPWILPEVDKWYKVWMITADDYGEVLGFADNNGLHIIPGVDCSEGYVDTIPIGSIFGIKKPITSVVKRGDGTAFIAGGVVMFSQGGFNMGSYSYSITIGDQYTHLIQMQQYVIAIGPNNIGVIYKSGLDANGTFIPKFEEISSDIGYFNPYSWQYRFRSGYDSFFLFNSDSELWKYDINVISDNIGTMKFSLTGQEFGMHYVSRYLKMLRREKGDHVEMHDNGRGMQIFITDSNNREERDTLVINYNEKYKFWHTRMFCGITLRNRYNNTYYGNKLWCYGGDTDNGAHIKQYASLTFGDVTIRTPKNLATLSFLLGHNTIMTPGNTRVDMRMDLQGNSTKYQILTIHNLPRLKDIVSAKAQKQDGYILRELMHGGGIYSGNGLAGNDGFINLDNVLNKFCSYNNDWGITDNNGCFDKHGSIILENEETHTTRPIQHVEQNQDSDYNFYNEIAKFSWAHIKGQEPFDLMTVEIMAKDGDRIHFGGVNVGYELMDAETYDDKTVVVFDSIYGQTNNDC